MVIPLEEPGVRKVRTSYLIRDYLNGAYEFPDDTVEDLAARPNQGDYISRMHQRVKAQFRDLAPEYQWPRGHSFKSFIYNLDLLGLVERTGVTRPIVFRELLPSFSGSFSGKTEFPEVVPEKPGKTNQGVVTGGNTPLHEAIPKIGKYRIC